MKSERAENKYRKISAGKIVVESKLQSSKAMQDAGFQSEALDSCGDSLMFSVPKQYIPFTGLHFNMELIGI